MSNKTVGELADASTACKFLFEALVLHFSTNSLYKSYWNSFTHSYWKTIRKIELDKVFFVKVGYECQTLEWLSKICIKNRINARLYNNNEWTQILGVREKKKIRWKNESLKSYITYLLKGVRICTLFGELRLVSNES